MVRKCFCLSSLHTPNELDTRAAQSLASIKSYPWLFCVSLLFLNIYIIVLCSMRCVERQNCELIHCLVRRRYKLDDAARMLWIDPSARPLPTEYNWWFLWPAKSTCSPTHNCRPTRPSRQQVPCALCSCATHQPNRIEIVRVRCFYLVRSTLSTSMWAVSLE